MVVGVLIVGGCAGHVVCGCFVGGVCGIPVVVGVVVPCWGWLLFTLFVPCFFLFLVFVVTFFTTF